MAWEDGAYWARAAGLTDATDLPQDADGWPLAVMLEWTYKNDFGVDPHPADWLIPLGLRADGTTYLGKSGEFKVVAVHLDGAWHSGGDKEAFARLRADAGRRFPDGANRLLREWDEDRWPTWRELAQAASPWLTSDEVDAWLDLGLTHGPGSSAAWRRPRGFPLAVPEDWFQTIGPVAASLMANGRFIAPWWRHAADNEEQLTWHRHDALPRPRSVDETPSSYFVAWLCQLVQASIRSADPTVALLGPWECHAASAPVPTDQPRSGWDDLRGVPAGLTRYTTGVASAEGGLRLSVERRFEVLQAGDGLMQCMSVLARAVSVALAARRPPDVTDTQIVRACYESAREAHETAARLCREITATPSG